jgi:hypothetical protein
LDTARDMVDKVIEIKREDGFSYVNVWYILFIWRLQTTLHDKNS